jgi:hypothetical protein
MPGVDERVVDVGERRLHLLAAPRREGMGLHEVRDPRAVPAERVSGSPTATSSRSTTETAWPPRARESVADSPATPPPSTTIESAPCRRHPGAMMTIRAATNRHAALRRRALQCACPEPRDTSPSPTTASATRFGQCHPRRAWPVAAALTMRSARSRGGNQVTAPGRVGGAGRRPSPDRARRDPRTPTNGPSRLVAVKLGELVADAVRRPRSVARPVHGPRSVVSSYYGEPRATLDLDIVIDRRLTPSSRW